MVIRFWATEIEYAHSCICEFLSHDEGNAQEREIFFNRM